MTSSGDITLTQRPIDGFVITLNDLKDVDHKDHRQGNFVQLHHGLWMYLSKHSQLLWL